jgi:hypothetical protein
VSKSAVKEAWVESVRITLGERAPENEEKIETAKRINNETKASETSIMGRRIKGKDQIKEQEIEKKKL